MLAGAGRHARTVTGLQLELGAGPCLDAHARGIPVLPDLSAENANRWPAFAAAALAGLAELLAAGPDRIVIHQASGMIAAQLDDTMASALARLRAAAFANGRSMYDVAQDVVERRVRFDE